MIFVDSSAWYTVTIPTDNGNAAASHWFHQNKQPLVTTDYILDETLTLLRARGQYKRAADMGARFFAGDLCRMYYQSPNDILAAWEVFKQFDDKKWSFTDCTSKIVMQKLGIVQAFSVDDHFRQFGSVAVVP